jgi:hypothetical protein
MKVLYIWAVTMLLTTVICFMIQETRKRKQAIARKAATDEAKRKFENDQFEQTLKLVFAVEKVAFEVAAKLVCPYCDQAQGGYSTNVAKVPKLDLFTPKGTEQEIQAAVAAMRNPSNSKTYHYVHQRAETSDQRPCSANRIHWRVAELPQ